MEKLEQLCDSYMSALCLQHPDPSHDILHVRRVVRIAKKLAEAEGADLDVVVPAAYLHDCVYISKIGVFNAEYLTPKKWHFKCIKVAF